MSRLSLNRRLVLEAQVPQPDGAGGESRSWVRVGDLWADVTARRGRRLGRGGIAVSRGVYVVTVRGAPVGDPARPLPQQRFREGTRLYQIQSVAEQDSQGRYLACLTHEEMAV